MENGKMTKRESGAELIDRWLNKYPEEEMEVFRQTVNTDISDSFGLHVVDTSSSDVLLIIGMAVGAFIFCNAVVAAWRARRMHYVNKASYLRARDYLAKRAGGSDADKTTTATE